jgi:hypothetical protein
MAGGRKSRPPPRQWKAVVWKDLTPVRRYRRLKKVAESIKVMGK